MVLFSTTLGLFLFSVNKFDDFTFFVSRATPVGQTPSAVVW